MNEAKHHLMVGKHVAGVVYFNLCILMLHVSSHLVITRAKNVLNPEQIHFQLWEEKIRVKLIGACVYLSSF